MGFIYRLSVYFFIFIVLSNINMMISAKAANKENLVYLTLEYGIVEIRLRPDIAPKHVLRIKDLIRQKFCDPNGNGTGGSGQNIPAEFSDEPHVRGTLSMARSSDPNSADSQFFIVFAKTPHLDGKYTVWGKVTKGMKFVSKIKRGDPNQNGLVQSPDKIVSMRIASDLD